MKVCNDCYTVFDDYINYKSCCFDDELCPIRSCNGKIIDIDENFIESYKLLNKKGYVTMFCCSAHSFDSLPNTYIVFNNEDESLEFPNLPKGFIAEDGELGDEKTKCITLRKYHKRNISSVKLQKEIWETAQDILKWVEKLECLE